MGLSYITYKGKEILFVDYTKCGSIDEMIKLLNDVKREYEKNPTQVFLAINDFTGVKGSSDYLSRATKLAKEIFDARTHKSAILGITGVKKFLLNSYNAFVENKQMPFKTKEDALEYLVS